ncbi:MAG: glycosyltransferase [Actinobacteria bacterium]|nr:glycosyltransferase [Actinomycetota bacterium]
MNIALLIPALNEEYALVRTAAVAREAIDTGLVTTATVLDGGSTDRTADIARSAGIDILHVPSLMPHLGEVLGKGDSLYRGVHAVDADWYVFLDADIGNIAVSHVAALVAPIATASETDVVFVKGGFVRVDENGVPRPVPGGRVTETVARPLLAKLAPELAALSQPLSGQVAINGEVARNLGFITGYGVEIAMLIDIWARFGMRGIVEVDMGEVQNRFKPDSALDIVTRDVNQSMFLRGHVDSVPDSQVWITERS